MKNGKLALIALSFATILLQSCAIGSTGNVISVISKSGKSFENAPTELRDLGKITGIHASGPMDVVYEAADSYQVIVEGDAELFDNVKTEVENGTVKVELAPGVYNNLWLRVRVCAPTLKDLSVSGSGSIEAKKVQSDGFLELRVSGSGDLDLKQVECGSFESRVSGSGDISINHMFCENMDVSVSGSGEIEVNHLKAQDADLKVSGSGEIALDGFARNVRAKVSGSGEIGGHLRYESLEKKKSGSGRIEFDI